MGANVDSTYYAVSGNADFIVAGGYVAAGGLRVTGDTSLGSIVTKMTVAT